MNASWTCFHTTIPASWAHVHEEPVGIPLLVGALGLDAGDLAGAALWVSPRHQQRGPSWNPLLDSVGSGAPIV